MELSLENFRVMIFYDFRKGLTQQQCYESLHSAFGDNAPSYSMVKKTGTMNSNMEENH